MLIIAFIRTVTFRKGPSGSGNFMICRLMPVGLFMFLSMNDFLPRCLFALFVIKCFMIGVNV